MTGETLFWGCFTIVFIVLLVVVMHQTFDFILL